MKYKATVDGTDFTLDVEGAGEIVVDGERYEVDLRTIDGVHLYSLIIDRRSYELHVDRNEGLYTVIVDGNRYPVDVGDARLKELIAMSQRISEDSGSATVDAPMPGLVVKVLVAVGDTVEEDQGLVILEAMKMENEIRSPVAGVVRQVGATAGQAVNLGDLLAVVVAETDDEAEDGEAGA